MLSRSLQKDDEVSLFEVISSDTVRNWRDLRSWEQKLMVALLPCARNRVKKLELAPWQKNTDRSLWLVWLWLRSENWQINFKSSVNDLESLKRVEMLKYGQFLQTQVCDTFSPMNSYNWLPNVPARATWVNWFSVEGGGVCNQMLIPCSIFPFCMRPILIIL